MMRAIMDDISCEDCGEQVEPCGEIAPDTRCRVCFLIADAEELDEIVVQLLGSIRKAQREAESDIPDVARKARAIIKGADDLLILARMEANRRSSD